MAVDYVVGAGVPRLGNFEAGAVASLTSPAVSAVSGGLASMLGALLIRLAFPAAAQMSSPASSEVHTTTRVRSPRNRSRANSSGSPDRA
jgi:hypothetical protein